MQQKEGEGVGDKDVEAECEGMRVGDKVCIQH